MPSILCYVPPFVELPERTTHPPVYKPGPTTHRFETILTPLTDADDDCVSNISFFLFSSFRFLATSQLQSIDARRVFPCFDEPDLKARFAVSIIHQQG